MFKLVGLVLLIVGSIMWMAWRAKRCSSCGCGVVEFEGKSSSRA